MPLSYAYDRLGHAYILLTMNVYTNARASERTEVAKKMEEAIV